MRTFVLSLCALLFSSVGFAQSGSDRIVTKSGETINCSIIFSEQNELNVYYHIEGPDGKQLIKFIAKRDIDYVYAADQGKDLYINELGQWAGVTAAMRNMTTPEIAGKTRFNIGFGVSQNTARYFNNTFFANAGFAYYLKNSFGIGAKAMYKLPPKSTSNARSTQSFFIGPSVTGTLFSRQPRSFIHFGFAAGYACTHISRRGDDTEVVGTGIKSLISYAAVSASLGWEFLIKDRVGIELSLGYNLDIASGISGFDGMVFTAGVRF